MNPTDTPPAIAFQGVEKSYQRFKLGPVNLGVPTGCIYGLIGPNGAGKSTLMDLVFGIGKPDAGRISVLGLDHVGQEMELKRCTGYVGPDLSYVGWRRVSNAIRFIRGFRSDWDEDYAQKLMEGFSIKQTDIIATLSFGSKTKLALLLAMAWKPKVLVLDEPTTGLDPAAKNFLFHDLLAAMEDGSRTVFVSSHELGGLERYADRVGVLHGGQLVAEGVTADLMDRFVRVMWREQQPVRLPGLWVERAEAGRAQGMVDLQKLSLAALTAAGAAQVEHQRMTLEEWFLILTQKEVQP
jgi:ABC-2 type transport system ATP-binding protein